MPTANARRAAPTYRYVFERDELDAIRRCHDDHGFAIVKNVITQEHVDAIKRDIDAAVNPKRDLPVGDSRYATVFIEQSPALLRLLDNEVFMRISRKVVGAEDLVVNRSAAILKSPGAKPGGWHTDFDFSPGPVTAAMNRGEWPNGLWFYLTGSNPHDGGLAIIEDSHRPDWPGPEGFPLQPNRQWFEPADGSWTGKDPFVDVPGVISLQTEPTDLVIFAARTYHAPHAHLGDKPRYSATIVFRPRMKMNIDWELSDDARRFLAALPDRYKPFFEDYTSLKKD